MRNVTWLMARCSSFVSETRHCFCFILNGLSFFVTKGHSRDMSNILPQNPPSLKRRRPQVYVEIPHSALLHSSSSPSPAQPKDNTPLRPSRSHSHNIMTTPNPAGAHSKKRKLADGEQDDDQTNQHDDAARPKAKKSKHSQVAPKQDTKKSRGLSQEYPTGFVHCHQCTKKRDATRTFRLI